MSKIVAFYLPQGMVIGEDITINTSQNKVITVKNPALVIARQNEVMLAPFLNLVNETSIDVLIEDVAFKTIFTPKTELANHYNQLFGSGIVIANTLQM